ncbi:MAG: GGDEF domain-containing protein [Arenimonas sp.]
MAWQFDIRTALLLCAALTLLIGVMLQAVSHGQSATYRAMMRWWVLGATAYAIGFALTGFRGWIWIGWTAVAANALIALGLAGFAVALRQFAGIPERRGHLFALAALCLVVNIAWALVWPHEPTRQIATSAIFAVVCFVCARAVYRRAQIPDVSHHVTGVYFVSGLALLLVRIALMAGGAEPVGDIFHVSMLSVGIYGLGGLLPVVCTIGFLLMCSERAQRELEQSARLDYLTGIYNRGAIEELAAGLIASTQRHGTPLSLMVVDIDHFKRINDELGHAAGDRALAATVTMIHGLLRGGDLIGRLGGEEFLVLMPDTDAIQARAAAERMRANVEAEPVGFEGVERTLTVSIGVAEYRVEDGGFGPLLLRADRALYVAKRSGRNQVQLDPLVDESQLA